LNTEIFPQNKKKKKKKSFLEILKQVPTHHSVHMVQKMAGKLGAIARETPILVAISLFKPNQCSPQPLKPGFCKYPSRNRSFSIFLTMAQLDPQNNSPEIKEPTPKIPKLDQNGVAAQISLDPTSLLKVKKLSEKAVLPSRGSPLSAGYDLSR
jgi:dUTP pyrophosphatase